MHTSSAAVQQQHQQRKEFQVPVALVGPIRAALQAQGLSPMLLGDDGVFNPAFLVSLAYDKAQIRSRFFFPLDIDLGEAIDPNVPTNPFVRFARPTVILQGRAGKNVIAPFGVAEPWQGWVGMAGILGAVFGLGYLFGRARRRL